MEDYFNREGNEMKSTEFLQSAMDVQKERGKQYDKPSGERSMAATVSAFNCITGYTLEEADGWMFMGLLKLVRQAQNPEKYHHDSALDASLYAEAASEQCGQVEDGRMTGGPIPPSSTYIVGEQPSDFLAPSAWKEAPKWANYLAMDRCGKWHWYEMEPYKNHSESWFNQPPCDGQWARALNIDSLQDDWTKTLYRRHQ